MKNRYEKAGDRIKDRIGLMYPLTAKEKKRLKQTRFLADVPERDQLQGFVRDDSRKELHLKAKAGAPRLNFSNAENLDEGYTTPEEVALHEIGHVVRGRRKNFYKESHRMPKGKDIEDLKDGPDYGEEEHANKYMDKILQRKYLKNLLNKKQSARR